MLLEQLLEKAQVLEQKNTIENLQVKGIANHTKDVKEGYIYVAIKGYITDGHKYIDTAIENGAVAVVVEDIIQGISIPQYRVNNSRETLSILSAEFYKNPSKSMRMIGVTATNGKTTTTYMLDSIFKKAKVHSGLIGSVIIKTGNNSIVSDLTTPESVDLQRYLSEMNLLDVEKVAMEVSSSALELYRVNDVEFDIVSFNNFSREHIDQHGTFEKYWDAKSSLIKNAKENSYAVLNLDDEYSKSLIEDTKAKVITYSLTKKEGNLYCKDLDMSKGRANFKLVVNKPFKSINGETIEGEFDISLGVPGYHSVANSMAAITIALIDGISPEFIKMGLKEFSGVERRFQYIYEEDFVIIDDHFANKGNINVTLETLKYMDYKKLHLVYAIRGNRGVTVNRENAETVGLWKEKLGIDSIIATKSIGDVTSRDKVTQEEEEVFKEAMASSGIDVYMYDTLKESIGYALGNVQEGDIIMLAGCQGMDHGAKIALNILRDMKPDISDEELYKSLNTRVV